MRDGGAAASRNSQLERLVDDKTRQKEAEGRRDFLIIVLYYILVVDAVMLYFQLIQSRPG